MAWPPPAAAAPPADPGTTATAGLATGALGAAVHMVLIQPTFWVGTQAVVVVVVVHMVVVVVVQTGVVVVVHMVVVVVVHTGVWVTSTIWPGKLFEM